MKMEQWSQQQIEDYRKNTNHLYCKVNELRNQAVKEFFHHIFCQITAHMRIAFYRLTHFGHKPQMR